MSEEMNKNHDATPFKLSEARKKGQVAKSVELPQFFSLLTTLSVVFISLSSVIAFFFHYTKWWLSSAHIFTKDFNSAGRVGFLYMGDISAVISPIMLSGAIATIVTILITVGPLFSFYPLKPDFKKLDPVKGFKKIFSRKSFVDLIRVVLKVSFFTWVAYLVWGFKSAEILNVNHASINDLIKVWVSSFVVLCIAMLAVFFVFALFDLWFSRQEFSRQMKMSTREVKEENKRREGDPEVKAKRKRNIKEILSKSSSVNNIKDSDVIITNPQHVAVALKYRPSNMALPVVCAKGQGFLAAFIRLKARKYGVPIVRKPWLARELIKEVSINEPIPLGRQQVVAGIYKWVISMPNCKVFAE